MNTQMNIPFSIGTFLGWIILLLVQALIVALPVMWLWNWLMPLIFGLKTLTWLEALGLNFLCSILFKGTVIRQEKKS